MKNQSTFSLKKGKSRSICSLSNNFTKYGIITLSLERVVKSRAPDFLLFLGFMWAKNRNMSIKSGKMGVFETEKSILGGKYES